MYMSKRKGKSWRPDWWLNLPTASEDDDWSSDDLSGWCMREMIESFLNGDEGLLSDNTDAATQYLIMLLLLERRAGYLPIIQLGAAVAQLRVLQSIRDELRSIRADLSGESDYAEDWSS